MDSNTPAISPLSGSTLATEKTAWPLNATVLLVFSLASSSESDRAGKATALSYPVDPPRPYRNNILSDTMDTCTSGLCIWLQEIKMYNKGLHVQSMLHVQLICFALQANMQPI